MDIKDLELLQKMFEKGRCSTEELSSTVNIDPSNIQRRLKLLEIEGILKGFSAFFDRRTFGFDTTYVKLNFSPKERKRVVKGTANLPQISSVLLNLDDFLLAEVVHWDTKALQSTIRALERISPHANVTSHYFIKMPDEVPERPRKKDLELLLELVRDGMAPADSLSRATGVPEDEIEGIIRGYQNIRLVRVQPLIDEGALFPFPPVSAVILTERKEEDEVLTELINLSRDCYWKQLLSDPPGLFIRSFGGDLHRMDDLLERYRRVRGVLEVMVIIPDRTIHDRSVDMSMIKLALGKRSK